MAFAPIPEYEGKSPYVFITYAQQDEKIAYPIAVKMFNEGFRIWSSAACGNPSNMRIAERLSNSEVAVVFLSRSYLKYASYKEFEPRAVMSSPKQKIVICLDDTPLGTDWNTVDFPAGIRYNPKIPQELWLRINSSDTLEKCRGAWPSRPMPLPFDEKSTLTINVDSFDETELSHELDNLNSVMSSFGAGLDDKDAQSITLFQKKLDDKEKFEWHDKPENTQEQEYYAIENLIDTTPMPAEKKQYDSMKGLIENFMEKSNRLKEAELRDRISQQSEDQTDSLLDDFKPVPLSNFDSINMSQDTDEKPVMFTQANQNTFADNEGFTPIVIDYGNSDQDSAINDVEGYSMTRNPSVNRTERFATNNTPEPEVNAGSNDVDKYTPVFEFIADDRQFITSTEDNISDARLTYHLGDLNLFEEKEEIPAEPVQTLPTVDNTPISFTYDDEIPLPALSFAKREDPETHDEPVRNIKSPRKISVKYRKYWRVAVTTRINHIEYDSNKMYKVNGRWIPGEIYHTKMPNAKYTAVRNIAPKTEPLALPKATPPQPTAYQLNSNSRLFNAVNTFRTPSSQKQVKSAELIPEALRCAMREKNEIRRAEAIRQAEEQQEYTHIDVSAKNTFAASQKTVDENTPARKHKFSHEGGIKKSLMPHMETPVDTNVEQSHRQYGAKADILAIETSEPKKSKNKKSEQSVSDYDEDALIAIPSSPNQPKINYDPSAYCDMNLSEILFGESEKPKNSKKKKKK